MSDTAPRHRGPVPPAAGRFSERYRLGELIGTGGMSEVFAGYDTLLKRQVAIKLFAARADDEEDLKRQETEARLVASLNHHALTTLFDAGVDTRDPATARVYLVMERVAGDLKARLRGGPLTPQQVVYLGFDLAAALAYVHENGYLHRDIKPANVLIASRDEETRLRGKLTDFGISTIIGTAGDEEFTTGTAAYLSPEQVEGHEPTTASDVYALGLVLLEALTAEIAYPGGIEQSAYARLERDPEVPDRIPEPIARILRGMTARRPDDRLTTTQVIAALQDEAIDELIRQRQAADPRVRAPDEAARVAAVRRYDVLDTPPDDAFDQVTRLASRMLGAPIALVSIIDSDRVWHKSKVGTDIEEVDRNISFCSVTNPGRGAWQISDATVDPRTREIPFVVGEPEVRSYAAAPLVTHDGHNLGALCVYDMAPRRFSPEELGDLQHLAGIVMRELELRLASRRAIFDRDR